MTGEAEFDEVFFTDVEVPADCLLGPLHDGWGVGMAVLTNERGHIGAAVIGLERRLDAMRRHGRAATARRRRAPARSPACSAGAGRSRRWRVSARGRSASTAASLMKLGLTELMFDAAMLRGPTWRAPTPCSTGAASVDGMLAAPGGRIAGGTSQVQRNIIGERLLGLPREPKGAS